MLPELAGTAGDGGRLSSSLGWKGCVICFVWSCEKEGAVFVDFVFGASNELDVDDAGRVIFGRPNGTFSAAVIPRAR